MSELYVYAKKLYLDFLNELTDLKNKDYFYKLIDDFFIDADEFKKLIDDYYELYRYKKHEIAEFRNSEKYKNVKNINNFDSKDEIEVLEFEINFELYCFYSGSYFYSFVSIFNTFADKFLQVILICSDSNLIKIIDMTKYNSIRYLNIKYWNLLLDKYDQIKQNNLQKIKNCISHYLCTDLVNLFEIEYSNIYIYTYNHNEIDEWIFYKEEQNTKNIIKNGLATLDKTTIPGYIIAKYEDINYVVDIDTEIAYGKYTYDTNIYLSGKIKYGDLGFEVCPQQLFQLKNKQIREIIYKNFNN